MILTLSKSTSWTCTGITFLAAFSLDQSQAMSHPAGHHTRLPSHMGMTDRSRNKHDLWSMISVKLTCGVYLVKAVVVVPYEIQAEIIIKLCVSSQLEGTHHWLSCSITASKSAHRNLSVTTCELNCLHVLCSSDETLRKYGKFLPRPGWSIRVHGWMAWWCKGEDEEEEYQAKETATWQSRITLIRIEATNLESIRVSRTCARGKSWLLIVREYKMNSASIPENRSLLCLSSNESRTAKVLSLVCSRVRQRRRQRGN